VSNTIGRVGHCTQKKGQNPSWQRVSADNNSINSIKKQVIILSKDSNFTSIKIVILPGDFPVINSCGKEEG